MKQFKKTWIKGKLVLSLITFFIYISIHFACKPMLSADLILLNGKIITVNKNFTVAEAVAISEDKILAVGSNNQIRKLADMAILTEDFLNYPVEKIKDIESVAAILGGKIIYSSTTGF